MMGSDPNERLPAISRLLSTADGEKTWNAAPISTIAALYDVKNGSDGSIRSVGEWGTVIRGTAD